MQFITGTVTVPEAAWPELLALAATRTRELLGASQDDDGDEAREPEEFTPEYAKVLDAVTHANHNARTVYQMLASRAGERISIDEVGQAVTMSLTQTPGLLGSMGRSLKSRNIERTWSWDDPSRTLTMPPSAAGAFLKALKTIGFSG